MNVHCDGILKTKTPNYSIRHAMIYGKRLFIGYSNESKNPYLYYHTTFAYQIQGFRLNFGREFGHLYLLINSYPRPFVPSSIGMAWSSPLSAYGFLILKVATVRRGG
jgi:hypothetical protein